MWALVTTVIMLAALAGSLTIKRRRVWVRLAPVAGGGTAVEIAGLARTDRAGWGPEFSELVEEILGEHPDDDGDDDELDDLG